MCANESDIEENNKNEIWYGWIPKLSHEMVVKVKIEKNDYENKFFDEVEPNDLKKVFKTKHMPLSDRIIDRFLNKFLNKNMHYVKFSNHNITECECCKEKVWSVTVEIEGKNNKCLIKGTANIHKSGLVRYEIICNKVKEEYSIIHKIIKNVRDWFHLYYFEEEHSINKAQDIQDIHKINKAQDIHKIVRGHIHFHLYHSSDMPLPPVKVDEDCNEDLAKEKILRKFLDVFIEYKRAVGKVNLAKEEKDLSRALGEIVYANSALNKFSEKEKYLFSWDDVPESNTELIKFLKDNLKIEWVEDAEIKKSDNETITVTDKNNNANLITIKPNKAEKKINLEIAGEKKIYEYMLKEEDGRKNTYKEEKNYKKFKGSFENFNESFKMLLQSTNNRRNKISQYIMVLLSFTIAMFAIINTLPVILHDLILHNLQFILHNLQFIQSFSFSEDDLIKFLLPMWLLGTLYLIYEIYKLRGPQKRMRTKEGWY